MEKPVIIDYTDDLETLRDKLVLLVDDVYNKLGSLDGNMYDFVAESPIDHQSTVSIESDDSNIHTQSHAIDSATDHTSSIAQNNLMDADANGLPDDSGIAVGDVVESSAAIVDNTLTKGDGGAK